VSIAEIVAVAGVSQGALYRHHPSKDWLGCCSRSPICGQHDLLPRLAPEERPPVEAVTNAVTNAMRSGEIAPVDSQPGARAIMGIVLQTAVFHIYGRLQGPLMNRASDLLRAAAEALSGAHK
jgi:AcrR family transcriptional regulator